MNPNMITQIEKERERKRDQPLRQHEVRPQNFQNYVILNEPAQYGSVVVVGLRVVALTQISSADA
jgi:hypothetical protein